MIMGDELSSARPSIASTMAASRAAYEGRHDVGGHGGEGGIGGGGPGRGGGGGRASSGAIEESVLHRRADVGLARQGRGPAMPPPPLTCTTPGALAPFSRYASFTSIVHPRPPATHNHEIMRHARRQRGSMGDSSATAGQSMPTVRTTVTATPHPAPSSLAPRS